MIERFYSRTGKPTKPERKFVVGTDGKSKLEIVGKINVQDEINGWLESTDINVIIARFKAGDADALSARQEIFGDFTEMPKTLAEMMQRKIDADMLFDSLPARVKAKFNYDRGEFFAKSGSKEWFENCKEAMNDDAVSAFEMVYGKSDFAAKEEVKE